MSQVRFVTTLFLTVAVVLCAVPLPVRAEESGDTVRLLVELKDKNDELPLSKIQADAIQDEQVLSSWAPRAYKQGNDTVRANDLRAWRVIEVAQADAEEVRASLQDNPEVAHADYVRMYHTATLPNDALFSQQYGLASTTAPLADINAPEAWDITTGTSDTVIAIIDGGVDATHEDLAGKMWSNPRETAGNGVDDDGNGFIDDMYGWDFVQGTPGGYPGDHATHVAGIAAADSNNNLGVTGVDWQARIMSVRVLSGSGVGSEDNIVGGINYAVANGADIINLSLVGPSSPAMLAAIENAYAAGVVVVAAAGNSNVDTAQSPQFPACADVNGVDMVLGVAATDDNGEPAYFSNYGRCINIAAPGYRIHSAKADNRYGTMSGTSMSAPFVAGVAGLYKSSHPSASAAQIIAAVSQGDIFTGDDAAEWNSNYKGKLNAETVVTSTVTAPPTPTPNPEPSPESGGGGGGSGGGGGGGGGGGDPEPVAVKKPQVLGTQNVKISASDRKAPDFIKNPSVPAVVAKVFKQVYGRAILPAESTYWKLRARTDKATVSKLRGAMRFQKHKGFTMPKIVIKPILKPR